MTDFRDYLHPRDRTGRWRAGLGPHRTANVPAAEVAALRHLRPGQGVVLPHGTHVRRELGDLEGPRDFRTDLPRPTAARAEDAAALGVPQLARPDLRAEFPLPGARPRPPTPTHRVSTPHAYPGGDVAMSPGRVTPDKLRAYARNPGLALRDPELASRAADLADGKREASTPFDKALKRMAENHREAARAAARRARSRPMDLSDDPDHYVEPGGMSHSVFLRTDPDYPRSKDWAVKSTSYNIDGSTGQSGYSFYPDQEAARSALRAKRARAGGDRLGSPGRAKISDEERSRHIRAAQAGPKPEPVGDIFTALNQAIEVVRARGQGREPQRLHGAPPLASPGRAEADPDPPPFPKGGITIVSDVHALGPYSTWEQAAQQLLWERQRGITSARASRGRRREPLTAEEQNHLVEVAARMALAAREAAQRDREAIAAIVLRPGR